MTLTREETLILRLILLDPAFQNLIGGENWVLTEEEEMKLWEIIEKFEKENP